MENKRHRFEKVATNRVKNILKYIELLSNCSNVYNYEYTKEDVDKIFKAINSQLKTTKASFDKNLNNNKFEL